MAVKNTTYIKALNQENQIHKFYLHLNSADHLPIVLGTGRNAVVFLATTTPNPHSIANSYHAIKFLRDDIDKQYARASADRFFQEADKVNKFDLLQGTFVRYFGWGAIGRPEEKPDEKGEFRDFWWHDQFAYQKDALINDEEDDELSRLRAYYNLQGPFYILDLCQGTLHDLLEKNIAWSSLPPYSVANFKSSLLAQQERISSAIDEIAREYLTRHPAGRSGYDILNSFNKENRHANMIRSRAVLEIFRQIAYTVSQLHKKKDSHDPVTHELKTTDPLAHRDLKPGNIFFKHDANVDGLNNIVIQLSDLGYVTNARQIESGDMTMRAGQKGVEYQAPGSQFFRAPEQSELPIEVRVDIVSDRVVRITGSKVNRIETQDWILISDIFSDKHITLHEELPTLRDPKIFKILKVTHYPDGHAQHDNGACYELELDEQVITSRKEDLQGQITRATGFQTDGFSLGAILYDLISGGRNPEVFYTYCIVSLIGQLKPCDGIKGIMDILCPESPQSLSVAGRETVGAEDLNLAERRKMMVAILEAHGFDELLQQIVEAAFSKAPFVPREELSFGDKIKIMNLIRTTPDIDNLIIALLDSPSFRQGVTEAEAQPLDETSQTSLREQLKNYRFRNFDLVKSLLEDRRGEKIPRDILQIIVSCMVRDVEGSYYKRDPIKGFTSDDNFEAATRIHDDVQRLLSEPQYRLPEKGFPKSLEDNLLFKLRSLARPPTSTHIHSRVEE